MKHLIMLLNPINYQWNTIGVQLCVPHHYIKNEEQNVAHDNTQRLTEVFQHWMDGTPHEATWRSIIDVVKRAPIENKKVVNDIFQFLTRPDIQMEYLFTNKSGISKDTVNKFNIQSL